MECICLPSFFKEFNYLYPPANWWCRPCTPGDYCLENQNLSCPLHASSTSFAQSYVDCYCDPAFKNSTNRTEQNFCEECPANSWCTGKGQIASCVDHAVAPVQSAANTACYCNLGWKGVNNTACVACQSPTYCYGGVQAQCSEGTYSPALAFDRLNCSCIAGRWGPTGGPCILCSVGKYNTFPGCIACSNTSDVDCQLCALGTSSSLLGRNTGCDVCGAGKYSYPENTRGALTCQLCANGKISGIGWSNCSTCLAGYYALSGTSVCTVCPAGTFGVGLIGACSACEAGKYSLSGATACSTCSVCVTGQYNVSNCISSANTVCEACANLPIGAEYTGVGYAGPGSCPWMCGGSFYLVSNSYCGVCPVGYWCIYNHLVKCPDNSWFSLGWNPAQSNCGCNAGFFGVGGWNNSWQLYPNGLMIQPPANWSGVNCEACPAGKYNMDTGVTGSSRCLSCTAGTYSARLAATSTTDCIACQSGTYSSGITVSSSASCTTCQTGLYSTGVGKTTSTTCQTCSVCVTGQYNVSNCISSANVVCGDCANPLKVAHAGRHTFTSTGFAGEQSCSWCCNPGLYLTLVSYGLHACTGVGVSASWAQCGIRYYCPDNSQTYIVSPGTQTACTCNAGFTGVGGWSNTWQDFPVGVQLQPPADWSGVNCETCQSGKYNTGTGITMSSRCLSCTAGTYSTGQAVSSSSQCASCHAGTYQTGTGASLSSACQNCQSGTYSTASGASGGETCANCWVGKYGTGQGIASSSFCTDCPAGVYSYAGMSACLLCAAGKYKLDPGCAVCSDQTDADCEPCYSGSASNQTGRPTFCDWCLAGTYSFPASTAGALVCERCGNGTVAMWEGMGTCSSCALGKYAPVGASACQDCPFHTYLDLPYAGGVQDCKACPAGTTAPYAGIPSVLACLGCATGKYELNRECVPCEAGQYAFRGVTACSTCGDGTVSGEGAESCTACQLGKFAPARASVCQDCPLHTYLDFWNAGTVLDCKACLAGTYNLVLAASSPSQCMACPPGTYEQSRVCVACLMGQYAPTGQATACLTCPSGFFTQAGASVCKDCLPGTYSASDASGNCSACPAGTFSWGGVTACQACMAAEYSLGNSSTCVSCQSGSYNRDNGSSTCFSCPPGSYAGVGVSACLACSYGMFNNQSGRALCQECQNGTYASAGSIEVNCQKKKNIQYMLACFF